MADVTKLRALVDTYGVAVRAGAMTPCIEDEKYFRGLFGMPEMSPAIIADWKSTDNVRKPITLKQDEPQAPEVSNEQTPVD